MSAQSSRQPGLRTIVSGATIALAGLVLVVTAALILLTTSLHRSSEDLRSSVAGVRLAQDATIQLLLHDRAGDRAARAAVEAELLRDLADAGQHITSSGERAVLERAVADVDRYLAASRAPDTAPAERARLRGAADRALERLKRENVAQADAAYAEAARWDALADVIGVAASLTMLAILGALAVWIRRSVLRPLYGLAAAMGRFGAGALECRAEERGAAELREMARRFNAMASSLAKQHRGRSAYLAGVAHDLRNPLSALQMSASLIDPDAPLPSEDRVRHVISVVRRQVTRLNRMIGDLLETSSIEAGHLELRVEDGDLSEIAREVARLFEGTSPLHSVQLSAPGPLPIRCDPHRIEQALNNLVSNAIKYSPRGGEIRIAAFRDGVEAVASVTDRGVGIAKEDIEHLWEPFRRGGIAAEMIPGAGLGLSVSKRIIDAHGGMITVESAPEVGSTFAVRLPLRAPPLIAPASGAR